MKDAIKEEKLKNLEENKSIWLALSTGGKGLSTSMRQPGPVLQQWMICYTKPLKPADRICILWSLKQKTWNVRRRKKNKIIENLGWKEFNLLGPENLREGAININEIAGSNLTAVNDLLKQNFLSQQIESASHSSSRNA